MENFMKFGKAVPICCLVSAIAIQLGIMLPYMGLVGAASNYNEKSALGGLALLNSYD